MTTLQDDLSDVHPGRAKIEIALALAEPLDLTGPSGVVTRARALLAEL